MSLEIQRIGSRIAVFQQSERQRVLKEKEKCVKECGISFRFKKLRKRVHALPERVKKVPFHCFALLNTRLWPQSSYPKGKFYFCLVRFQRTSWLKLKIDLLQTPVKHLKSLKVRLHGGLTPPVCVNIRPRIT